MFLFTARIACDKSGSTVALQRPVDIRDTVILYLSRQRNHIISMTSPRVSGIVASACTQQHLFITSPVLRSQIWSIRGLTRLTDVVCVPPAPFPQLHT